MRIKIAYEVGIYFCVICIIIFGKRSEANEKTYPEGPHLLLNRMGPRMVVSIVLNVKKDDDFVGLHVHDSTVDTD
jgi:hypothetical protein